MLEYSGNNDAGTKGIERACIEAKHMQHIFCTGLRLKRSLLLQYSSRQGEAGGGGLGGERGEDL